MLRLREVRGFQHEQSLLKANKFIKSLAFNAALSELEKLVKRISARPASSMQIMPSQALDACFVKLASAWRKINVEQEKSTSPDNYDILILTSALYERGGHTREIEDLISSLGNTKKIALILGFKTSKSDPKTVQSLFAKVDGFSNKLSSNLARMEWMVQNLEQLNSKVIFVAPSPNDVALFSAIAASRITGRLVLNLNLDHNVSPGLFIPRIDQILTKRPYLYSLLKNDYQLAGKVIYIPFSRKPSIDERQLQDLLSDNGQVVTASCTSVTYKIENQYIYQFADIVSELICQLRIRHVHIGAISVKAKHRIYKKLSNCGLGKEYFIHIPFASRLSDVFIKYHVNVLIQTFPVGGGLVAIEAMECGLAVVSHRCYSTKLYNPVDFCYAGAPAWSEPEELIQLIQNMQGHQLKQHREKSRAHYLKYNMSGGNEKLLTDNEFQGFQFNELMYKKMFDYPLDEFRISANFGLENLIKKRRHRSFITRLQRIPMKIKRLFP